MSETHFRILLDRYLNDSINAEELPLFLAYLRQYQYNPELQDAIQKALTDNTFGGISDKSRSEIIFRKIMETAAETPVISLHNENYTERRRKIAFAKWIAVAAVLITVAAGAFYFLLQQKTSNPVAVIKKTTPRLVGDVGPGGNKAILKLADGTSVVLDDAVTGTIATQGDATVQKLNDGELAYERKNQHVSIPLYNTISTPRGGQYSVLLPDGSRVWLNAESSLYFPTAFTGNERSVVLTGEAYFEIAHNKDMPFKVQVNDMNVEVLGTHFNIMSYDNEASAHTTLLEGSVKVSFSGGKRNVKLTPGQQAIRKSGSEVFSVREADVELVTAWKNGMFQFQGDDIQTIMRQIERWYDVDVHYSGKIPEGHYSGTVSRDNNLLKVLKIFGETDLRFEINGKELTVL